MNWITFEAIAHMHVINFFLVSLDYNMGSKLYWLWIVSNNKDSFFPQRMTNTKETKPTLILIISMEIHVEFPTLKLIGPILFMEFSTLKLIFPTNEINVLKMTLNSN